MSDANRAVGTVVRHDQDHVRRRGLLVERANRVLDLVFLVVRGDQRDDEATVAGMRSQPNDAGRPRRKGAVSASL